MVIVVVVVGKAVVSTVESTYRQLLDRVAGRRVVIRGLG